MDHYTASALIHRIMLATAGLLALIVSAAAQDQPPAAGPEAPLWAFPPAQMQTVPGSTKKLSEVVIYDRTRAVDWFPEQHPSMPDAVKGRAPVFACGFCHLPSGDGRPENATVAGLPEAYIKQQIADMKSGARVVDPHFTTGANMVLMAKMSSEADVDAAAKYYAGLKHQRHLKVVETEDIPRATPNSVYVFDNSGTREPLGERIVEGPDDFEQFERRDPSTRYTAYVPVGSIVQGTALAQGKGGHVPCETCHGPGLKGSAIGPPIAGHFATTTFRQLYAFETGTRNGVQSALMKPIVAGLSQNDMIALSAYVASLEP